MWGNTATPPWPNTLSRYFCTSIFSHPGPAVTSPPFPPVPEMYRRKKPRGRASRRLTSNKLNDDILLNIFHLYQLDYLYTRDEEDSSDRNVRLRWDRQRWWYKLAQVCRRWRCLILAYPIRLDINLLCSYGVPVADMLAHSPPLPLTIWYSNGDREMTAKDEE
ncbi:hypothetical protein BGW80DRAFT_1559832, partial [Lactifluus volemus]